MEEEYGFIDKTGEFVLEPQFARAWSFSEGLAGVALEAEGACGFIDRSGTFVIQPQYSTVEAFSGGLALVYLENPDGGAGGSDESWIYIDPSGKVVWQSQ